MKKLKEKKINTLRPDLTDGIQYSNLSKKTIISFSINNKKKILKNTQKTKNQKNPSKIKSNLSFRKAGSYIYIARMLFIYVPFANL